MDFSNASYTYIYLALVIVSERAQTSESETTCDIDACCKEIESNLC